MTTNTHDMLHENCVSIAKQLEQDSQQQESRIWEDAMDIEFTIDPRRNFIGARILIAFGGPNIWVNTRNDTVEGSWGSDRIQIGFDDDNFIHETCEQYFESL